MRRPHAASGGRAAAGRWTANRQTDSIRLHGARRGDQEHVAGAGGPPGLPVQGARRDRAIGRSPGPGRATHAQPLAPWAALQDASGTTLAFTGILGLAVVYALWQLRGGPGRQRAPQRHWISPSPLPPPPLLVRPPAPSSLNSTLPIARAALAGRKRDEHGQQAPGPLDPSQPSTSAAAAARGAAAAAAAAAAATPAAAVARRLAGVRRVTLSVPGVLLEQRGAEELDENASVQQGAAGGACDGWHAAGRAASISYAAARGPGLVMPCPGAPAAGTGASAALAAHARLPTSSACHPCQLAAAPAPHPLAELVRHIAARADCYLMCHVDDDIGEALVRGALEHAGVTGSGPGQVPTHRCAQGRMLGLGMALSSAC